MIKNPAKEISPISQKTDPFHELVLRSGGGQPIKTRADLLELDGENTMNPTPQDNTPQTTTNLINELKKGKKSYDEFGHVISKLYQVAGKTMGEWQEYFKIALPPDPNPSILQDLDSHIMALHHEASFHKAKCNLKLQTAKDRYSSKYRKEYTKLVMTYQNQNAKLPARDTLNTLVEEEISEIKDMITHAEIELDFWKEVLNDLNTSRRLIENVTLNISVETKALMNQQYIDALNKKSLGEHNV